MCEVFSAEPFVLTEAVHLLLDYFVFFYIVDIIGMQWYIFSLVFQIIYGIYEKERKGAGNMAYFIGFMTILVNHRDNKWKLYKCNQ